MDSCLNRKFWYKLELDGIEAGRFSEISGFDAGADTIEYRERGQLQSPTKLPCLKKHGRIMLKQGLIDARIFKDWVETGANGEKKRKTVVLTLQGDEETPAVSWRVENAWSVKYTGYLEDADVEAEVESLEVGYEEITKET